MAVFDSTTLPKQSAYFYVRLTDGMARIAKKFPPPCAASGTQTHNSRVALRDHFMDASTTELPPWLQAAQNIRSHQYPQFFSGIIQGFVSGLDFVFTVAFAGNAKDDASVFADDAQNRQTVTRPDLEVGVVVAGRHLDGAGPELRVDGRVGDDRDQRSTLATFPERVDLDVQKKITRNINMAAVVAQR